MKSFRFSIITGIICILIITSTCSGLIIKHNNANDINQIYNNNKIVLISGFEPFGVHEINPSQFIAENLSGEIINNASVIGITLPVDYLESVAVITDQIECLKPILVISLGLAANYKSIGIEKLALNLKRIKNDNWPYYKIQRIDPNGPLFRVSHLPSFKIAKEIRNKDISAKASFYGGIYICNALLYNVLGYIKEHNLNIKAGFIHVPLLSSQNPSGMDLEDMISATTIAIEQTLDHFYKNFLS